MNALSYVSPNSDVWLLRGVNLEPSYTHTFCPSLPGPSHASGLSGRQYQFDSIASNLHLKYHLQQYSYQRKNSNVIRVKKRYLDVYDCNYMIFKNNAPEYENKYFYAFITSVDYVNENTTEIKYQIDVMQTWWYDFTFNSCFVEREHTSNDLRGNNIIAEPVPVGDMIAESVIDLTQFYHENWYVVFTLTCDAANLLNTADGQFTGGVWNQSDYLVFKCYSPTADPDVLDPSEINAQVKLALTTISVFQRNNAVVSMYVCPESLLPDDSESAGFYYSLQHAKIKQIYKGVELTPSFGGWTPHNKKLYTFPYCYFTVDNNQGNKQEFKYELFRDCRDGEIINTDIGFEVFRSNAITPEVRLVPINYENYSLTDVNNYEYAVDIKDIPKGTWATNDLVAKAVQGTIGIALGALVTGGNPLPGITKAIKTADFNMASFIAAEHDDDEALVDYFSDPFNKEPPKRVKPEYEKTDFLALGKDLAKTVASISLLATRSRSESSIGNGSINLASGCFGYFAKVIHVETRYAQIIDQFFDMYGYQTNQIKIPNVQSRQFWNYVKTTNCTIHGNIPHDDAQLIQKIMDNGITFWNWIENIGRYELADTSYSGGNKNVRNEDGSVIHN